MCHPCRVMRRAESCATPCCPCHRCLCLTWATPPSRSATAAAASKAETTQRTRRLTMYVGGGHTGRMPFLFLGGGRGLHLAVGYAPDPYLFLRPAAPPPCRPRSAPQANSTWRVDPDGGLRTDDSNVQVSPLPPAPPPRLSVCDLRSLPPLSVYVGGERRGYAVRFLSLSV